MVPLGHNELRTTALLMMPKIMKNNVLWGNTASIFLRNISTQCNFVGNTSSSAALYIQYQVYIIYTYLILVAAFERIVS